MRILVLDSTIPFPPITGAQSRSFHLLKSLWGEHDVTLVAFSWDSSDLPLVNEYPVEVIRVPWTNPEIYRRMHDECAAISEAAYRYLSDESSEPWFVSYYESPAMGDVLTDLKSTSFDLILIVHSFMARFLPFLPPDVPIVLDMHNVYTLMAWRRVEEASGPAREAAIKEFHRTRSFERMACHASRLCLCCSEQDAEAARCFLDARDLKVIPNGVDTAAMTSTADPATPGFLLFTGTMNYAPNVEAVQYFASEILPLIRAELPFATFHIAGAKPTEEVEALASASVFVHGFVPDMRPYFSQAAVVVVPLLHGGGTRLKILEAAACGKAIVSTRIGAEGLAFADGRDILLADSPELFARAVVRALGDPQLRSELSKNARRTAEAYEWSKIAVDFRTALMSVRVVQVNT